MFRTRVVLAAVTALTALPPAVFASEHPNHPGSMNCESMNCESMNCQGMTMAQEASGTVLSHYRITSVNPYFEELTNLKRTFREERGAVVTIEARPGLTAQWLQVRLDRELTALHENAGVAPESPLAVAGARANVSSRPDGFAVTITAPDRASGAQVLQRAEAIGAQAVH
jgi:hypothetical protein